MVRIANCTKEEFARQIQLRKILLFTAGRMAKEFCADFNIIKNVDFVVDNYKIGDFYYAGVRVPIINIEQVVPINFAEYCKFCFSK